MSHIVVGERIAGAAPQIVGHLIVGAGHIVEQVGGLFQTGAPHMPAIPVIAQRSINDLSTPVAAEQWQWDRLNGSHGSGSLLAGSNHESSAWQNYMNEPRNMNSMEMLRELALGTGSAFTGDFASAAEHGANAIGMSVEGFLRDMGFMGGWGEGFGTMDANQSGAFRRN